jgi:hypothetical protein
MFLPHYKQNLLPIIRLPKSAISSCFHLTPSYQKTSKHYQSVPCIIALPMLVMTCCRICCHASVPGKSMLYNIAFAKSSKVSCSSSPRFSRFLVNSAFLSSLPPALPADSQLLSCPNVVLFALFRIPLSSISVYIFAKTLYSWLSPSACSSLS